MSWRPSEGLRRAEAVANEIEEAAIACGLRADGDGVWSTLRWRVVEIVAKALDRALANEDANGQTKWWTPETESALMRAANPEPHQMDAEAEHVSTDFGKYAEQEQTRAEAKAPKRKPRKAKGRRRKVAAEPTTTDTATEA